jgi:flavodoxin
MGSLIIYSSQFGNTEKIAKAIGEGLTQYGEVKVMQVAQATAIEWGSVDVLIVGSPTQGGRATKDIQDFLNNIPAGALKNKKVAAFDTRFAKKDHNFALQMLMKVIDYAAGKIAKILESKGGTLAASPEGFIVMGKEGPLFEGELERAEKWGKIIVNKKTVSEFLKH